LARIDARLSDSALAEFVADPARLGAAGLVKVALGLAVLEILKVQIGRLLGRMGLTLTSAVSKR
jgi:hypothetical protein